METIPGPVTCRPIVCNKETRSYSSTIYTLAKNKFISNSFWRCNGHLSVEATSPWQCKRRNGAICCKFNSSSNGNGRMADNFGENDEDYVNSVVIEAVEIMSNSDGLFIKMRDGQHVQCIHNNPPARYSPDYAPHPAIVLKMDDASGLLLPIVVPELPSVLLMVAIRSTHISRPSVYEVIKEIIGQMNYKVHLVRITKRVQMDYFARLYLAKIGNETHKINLDLRPSDAINIAFRFKAPIQVSRKLALLDGMRPVEPPKHLMLPPSDGLFSELDRPSNQPCLETIEFNLVRNMLVAVVEERYKDAAQWRDRLLQLRSKRKKWT